MSIRCSARLGALCFLVSFPATWSCSSDSTESPGSAGAVPSGAAGSAGSGLAGAPGSAGAVVAGGAPNAGSSSGGAAGHSGVAGAAQGGASGAGSSAGGAAPTAGSGSVGFGGAPTDKPDTIEVGVRNNCAFPIWIHSEGNGGVLGPDDQKLETKATVWYDAPKSWSAARVT